MINKSKNLFNVSARDILLNKKTYSFSDVYPELVEGDDEIIITNKKKDPISDRIEKKEESIEDINDDIERNIEIVMNEIDEMEEEEEVDIEVGIKESMLVDVLKEELLMKIDIDLLEELNNNIKTINDKMIPVAKNDISMDMINKSTDILSDVISSGLAMMVDVTDEILKIE